MKNIESICNEVLKALQERINSYYHIEDKQFWAIGPEQYSAGLKKDKSITVASFVMYLENMIEETQTVIEHCSEEKQNKYEAAAMFGFALDKEELLNGFLVDLCKLKDEYEFDNLNKQINELKEYIQKQKNTKR